MSVVVVRFAPASLRTNNAALDLEASALRYREALASALRAALPGHTWDVVIDPSAHGLVVEVDTDDVTLARTLERDALDHAWVVRQMADWTVVGSVQPA
ncbi:MAG: hypothetical protein OHK0013_18490 [Sandaracinaceae bacterium]